MNNYFVLIEATRVKGPYTFKEAMEQKRRLDEYDVDSEILKRVVNILGKEVK